ncbi:MAG: DNA polymerase III subunit beta [Candidatus Nomurabacteria bacterium]|jgi:DNA polymerase-3 subunit beta|nr:DNA polymerase III subunit beta [Candidatus Nomurabacteria bacterium]
MSTQFTIKQSTLKTILSPLVHITGESSQLPITKNILIQIAADELTLKSTNLSVGLIQKTKKITKFTGDETTILVLAKPLLELITNLPSGEITISVNDEQRTMTIKTDQNLTTLQLSNADEFPILPEIEEKDAIQFSINADILKSVVSKTIFAHSNDMSRPIITGIYFNTQDSKLYAAATDGYRLSDCLISDYSGSKDLKTILPFNFVGELNSLLGDNADEVNFFITDESVKVTLGNSVLFSNIIDGKYPDYRTLIPKSPSINIVLDKEALLGAIRTTAVFAKESQGVIILKASKKDKALIVKSLTTTYGENTATIPTNVSDDCQISLNSRYLTDGINSLSGDRVVLGLTDGMRPISLKQAVDDNTYTHIIMPIRGEY